MLALTAHPVFVAVVVDGREANLHVQFRGLEKQLLHHLSRAFLVDADKYSQRESGVDVGLSDVKYLGIIACQDCHYRRGESRTVLSGDADKYLFFLHSGVLFLRVYI